VASREVERWPSGERGPDDLAVEEPLEIRVEGHSLAITMRTPGDDLDLVAGFLYTEGIVDGPDDLVALAHVASPADPRENTVDCRLGGGVATHREALDRARREIYATSSCGICGKASIDRVHLHAPPLPAAVEPDPDVLSGLPAKLAAAQSGFSRTGGLHAAALFTLDGTLEAIREDVGRHNAVDKVLGARLRAGRVPVDDRLLAVSSRAGFEIVQKALVARVPVVAVLGAATSLAVDLATASGLSLYGFVRPDRFVRYA
jgi:FdhD protein